MYYAINKILTTASMNGLTTPGCLWPTVMSDNKIDPVAACVEAVVFFLVYTIAYASRLVLPSLLRGP
jgi:hypothetical protein